MTGTNKMRDQFENWHLDKYCGGVDRLKRCSNADNVYYYAATQDRWTAWQASREAVVVELPEGFSPNDCGEQAMWSDLVVRAIEAQGLKVKP